MEYNKEYFKNRGLEQKTYWMTMQWIRYFNLDERVHRILDWGCARGPYVHAMRYYGFDCVGYDVSQDAVDEAIGLSKGHITTNPDLYNNQKFDLVMNIDVLEHLEGEQIDQTIEKLIRYSNKYIILSVCCFGDENYERDPTHKTCRTYSWWKHQFEKRGCKHISTPSHFYFAPQFFIFEVPQ